MTRPHASSLLRDLMVILGLAGGLTGVAMALGWDKTLAVALYDPTNTFAWNLRQHGNWPGTVGTLAVLALLLMPRLRRRWPLVRRTAIVWLAALVMGGGVLVHLVGKEFVDRPRPRETVLLGGQHDFAQPFAGVAQLEGKSFPSGHTAMAVMLAVPFFTLRRRRPTLAVGFLVAGLGYAGLIGWGRMVQGAHFLTDNIWSITIVLATAAVAARFIREGTDLKTRYLTGFLLILALGVVLGNDFRVHLSHTSQTRELALHLPCRQVHLLPAPAGTPTRVDVTLTGYGAPLSNLVLWQSGDQLSLVRWRGLYHSLACTAEVTVPPEHKVRVRNTATVTNPALLKISPQPEMSTFFGKAP